MRWRRTELLMWGTKVEKSHAKIQRLYRTKKSQHGAHLEDAKGAFFRQWCFVDVRAPIVVNRHYGLTMVACELISGFIRVYRTFNFIHMFTMSNIVEHCRRRCIIFFL